MKQTDLLGIGRQLAGMASKQDFSSVDVCIRAIWIAEETSRTFEENFSFLQDSFGIWEGFSTISHK